MNNNFWKGKKVFITGHTGFKGSWATILLQQLGAEIKGFSLKPETLSLFKIANIGKEVESDFGDIRDLELLKKSICQFSPDVVLHFAAQPLVRFSYLHPIETFQTNVMGTINLLESIRSCESVKSVINVTTDKCYENKEWEWGYRETDPLGGYDPYSSSKACSEIVTAAYRQSFLKNSHGALIATARAGNVIGGGDWSEDRLVPDALRSFDSGNPVLIRNHNATRPWQHVIEPIVGYLLLAEKLYLSETEFEGAWNFGPYQDDIKTVGEVMDYLTFKWPGSASWEKDPLTHPHEAKLLKLDISKAISSLNWFPVWNLYEALDSIIEWHQTWVNAGNVKDVTINQINSYFNKKNNKANV